MNSVNDKYEALVKSYIDGQCTSEDALELLSWVAESEENRIYFKSQKEADEVWNLTDFAMPDDNDIDVEAALDAVNHRIDAIEETETKTVEMPWLRRNYKYVSGIAAAVVVALFLGFLVVKPMNSTVTVASNEQNVSMPFLLPDGTSVTFYSDAEISYPKQFIRSTRSVDFEGVAGFDVVANATKPFIIHCDKMDVEVLGTSFLLNANANSDKYFVDLYSGKVKMTAFDEKGNETAQIELLPGERGVLNLAQGELKAMTYPEVKAEELMNERVLDFNNVVLSTIVETLEYVYEVDIDLDEAYASKKLTVRFSDQETIDEVLETIATVFDFTVSKQNGVYLIR
ncbi:MAG: FecR domain-containing protein [Bacteroidales bacterium]|nr:FecR domain-containing protein [Bacteroidales bacterium]